LVRICSVDGCQNKSRARGYCARHYQKWIRCGDPLHVVKYGTKQCSIEKCFNKHMAKGFCEQHYGKWKRYGDPLYLVDPEETSKKLSESGKGRIWSETSRRKNSESNKGKNKGKTPSVETRLKIGKSNTGKKHTIKTKNQMSESHKGKKNPMYGKSSPNKGKKTPKEVREKIRQKIKIIMNTPERKAFQRDVLKKSRKNTARPNIPEITIGKILEEVGIKCKFLQDIDYKTLENKPNSKEMDIVWKDSVGNKKIIEYNGRYHFDPREHKPDEIHEVHRKPTKCQDLWDEETMILDQIRKEGYQILVVWQKDFLKDYENEVKKIIEFAKT